MTEAIIQLGLALTPAITASVIISNVQLPWEKKKHASERAELLGLLAHDIKRVKTIMASSLQNVNDIETAPPLPLTNWQHLKYDKRLCKYSDEPLFKTLISQFKKWEQLI